MRLIDEIEVSYFRSFYKVKINQINDLNVIFGQNDSGKSNAVRALNLFFNGSPERDLDYNFETDFCSYRQWEADDSENIKKFIYVKVTFTTPPNYQKSLGKSFSVKRQWNISSGDEYAETFSSNIPKSRQHIARRFINNIRFIYIPAIKSITIFENLLSDIYETIENSQEFIDATENFAGQIQQLTRNMFMNLPAEVSSATKIGAPTRMSQLFQTLDFETTSEDGAPPKSLTRQRGDGIKARHIPELLNYISENDDYKYHVWGFEEPENSLDFVASQAESKRMLDLSRQDNLQIFITTHSPSFYLLESDHASKYYIRKDEYDLSEIVQGRDLSKFNVETAINEGFYLPAVAEQLKEISEYEKRKNAAEEKAKEAIAELQQITMPVILTEGRTDAKIIELAWEKRRGGEMPFRVRSCETGGDNAGSGNGGATQLATCLKGVHRDTPHKVIGIFDYDTEGLKEFNLGNKNFNKLKINDCDVMQAIHGNCYAIALIAPEHRKECKKYKNLPIEFLFSDEALQKEVAGKRISLKPMCAFKKIGDISLSVPLGNETHFAQVESGKVDFATTVLPTLEPEEFSAFDPIFDLIEEIIRMDR